MELRCELGINAKLRDQSVGEHRPAGGRRQRNGTSEATYSAPLERVMQADEAGRCAYVTHDPVGYKSRDDKAQCTASPVFCSTQTQETTGAYRELPKVRCLFVI